MDYYICHNFKSVFTLEISMSFGENRNKSQILSGITGSLLAIFFLFFSVGYFYTQILADSSIFGSFLLGVVFLSASTDGLFLLLNIFRKPMKAAQLSFKSEKLSIIIACYNGESVISETVRQASLKVPKSRIYVISDASTDKTNIIVKALGVNLIVNEENKNKALSISHAIHNIKTPYVLILDDDTHIEETFIPTSLLDDGYAAVAFNVMPESTGTLVNMLQQFEYRKSMILGKELRAEVGAIGNVSGAIGLFRTDDLVQQIETHSGQFGGEDQQRTMMVHLESQGKGIAYVDSIVLTEAPNTFYKLFRQRYRSWNCSTHETFFLNLQVILSPKLHYLLKFERAYLLFILLTDPIRMLFIFHIFLFPINFLILYSFYVLLETMCWLKTGRKDTYLIVLLSPLYGLLKTIARFIAHFWWFKLKYDYLVKKKFHRYITGRFLIVEYFFVAILLFFLWFFAVSRYLAIL